MVELHWEQWRLKKETRVPVPVSIFKFPIGRPDWQPFQIPVYPIEISWLNLIFSGGTISQRILCKSLSPYGIIETGIYHNHYFWAWVWDFVHVHQSSVGSMTKSGGIATVCRLETCSKRKPWFCWEETFFPPNQQIYQVNFIHFNLVINLVKSLNLMTLRGLAKFTILLRSSDFTQIPFTTY